MTLLTGETEVFSAADAGGRCAVAFLAKGQPLAGGTFGVSHAEAVNAVLRELAAEDWYLSVRAMFDEEPGAEPAGFATGFAHGIDVAGVFEAPTISAALAGTVRLEQAGWSRRFATEWLLGPREFATVGGHEEGGERDWGFLALWEWNDAWAAATPQQRQEYDAECDVAFAGDLALDVAIAGRHRLDWASSWHHLGVWETPSFETVDLAMRGHEHANDFMFTTSRHFVGRRKPLAELMTTV